MGISAACFISPLGRIEKLTNSLAWNRQVMYRRIGKQHNFTELGPIALLQTNFSQELLLLKHVYICFCVYFITENKKYRIPTCTSWEPCWQFPSASEGEGKRPHARSRADSGQGLRCLLTQLSPIHSSLHASFLIPGDQDPSGFAPFPKGCSAPRGCLPAA